MGQLLAWFRVTVRGHRCVYHVVSQVLLRLGVAAAVRLWGPHPRSIVSQPRDLSKPLPSLGSASPLAPLGPGILWFCRDKPLKEHWPLPRSFAGSPVLLTAMSRSVAPCVLPAHDASLTTGPEVPLHGAATYQLPGASRLRGHRPPCGPVDGPRAPDSGNEGEAHSPKGPLSTV